MIFDEEHFRTFSQKMDQLKQHGGKIYHFFIKDVIYYASRDSEKKSIEANFILCPLNDSSSKIFPCVVFMTSLTFKFDIVQGQIWKIF